MFGIGIGILLVFTRSAGGATFAEALEVAGRFVFGWNALLIAAAIGSMLWFMSGRAGSGRPETTLLSGLMAVLGLAGLTYVKTVNMNLWYAGTALVLGGSLLLGWGPGAGVNAHALAGIVAAAAIGGGQYLRIRHRRRVAELHGASSGFSTGFSAGPDTTPHPIRDDRPVRHVGGKRVGTSSKTDGGSGSSEPGPGGGDGAG